MLVAVQAFTAGLYLPPVLQEQQPKPQPPQAIISLPVQTAVWPSLADGTLAALVAVQVSALGSYLPPLLK